MDINYLAVLAAALSTFVIGGLWYSPLMFHKAWMTTNSLTEADLKGGEGRIFGLAFLMALVMAANLAAFLSAPGTTVSWGMAAGALTGLGWILPAIATVALFERRSPRYVAINGGYFAVAFIVMGAILGAWR
ncbi:MAG: DUF1761 domain-containing protein [Acidobacteriota bacterium]|nr:DUF1761 domain-containing protein [Acidobacteriota bacterium]